MTAEELFRHGEEHGFPSVRVKVGMTLMAGEASWRKHLALATAKQRELLAAALWRGWSENRGCVGMVKP